MDELKVIPGGAEVQGLVGRGGARDGKPRLERRRRKKKRGSGPDEVHAPGGEEARPEVETAEPLLAEDEDEDGRGRHIDVRA